MLKSRKLASTSHRWVLAFVRLVLLATLVSSQLARAESQQDMLVFVSLEGFDMFSASDPELEGFDRRATADFLYTYNTDKFRFLAEYIWSDSESELERLQAAWQIDDRTMLWFGRFHSISNYWTTEYHHGQFMQTSISRPGLEEWEDESGPMPSHITGLWLEHEYSVNGQSAVNLGLVAGLAPKFEGEQLAPFDFLDPESGHDMAVSARVAYRPDVLSTNQIGLTLGHNDIAVVSESSPNLTDLNSILQTTLGVFSDWRWDAWRLSTNWVYFDVEMQYGNGDVQDDFVLGYLQGEYEAAQNWTVFGRTEIGFGEDNSPYLQLLSSVVAHRNMLGVRWDFADSHGLTLEVADTSTQGDSFEHDSFKELRVQWSAVFP
jgi:hypothetical protein